jgi:hypothetical protein
MVLAKQSKAPKQLLKKHLPLHVDPDLLAALAHKVIVVQDADAHNA